MEWNVFYFNWLISLVVFQLSSTFPVAFRKSSNLMETVNHKKQNCFENNEVEIKNLPSCILNFYFAQLFDYNIKFFKNGFCFLISASFPNNATRRQVAEINDS